MRRAKGRPGDKGHRATIRFGCHAFEDIDALAEADGISFAQWVRDCTMREVGRREERARVLQEIAELRARIERLERDD